MTKLILTRRKDRLHRVLVDRILNARTDKAREQRTQRLKEYHKDAR